MYSISGGNIAQYYGNELNNSGHVMFVGLDI
jgi:hypothetical protein